MRASQLKKVAPLKLISKEKAQSGKKVAKKKVVSKDPPGWNPDANLLTAKRLKPEKSMGDYKITSGSKGVTGRVRKNGGAVSYKAAAKAVGYKSGGKMGKCRGGC